MYRISAVAALLFLSGSLVLPAQEPPIVDFNELVVNGSAFVFGGGQILELTPAVQNQAGSAFYPLPVNIQAFTTDFLSVQGREGDGLTFTIQNTGPNALGGYGAGLGYVGIHHSVALKFDLSSHDGQGANTIGVYTAGNLPTLPEVDLSGSGIDLRYAHDIYAHVSYDGINLTLTLTNFDNFAHSSHSFPIDIPAAVFGKTAYVGFTASTGVGVAEQDISGWRFNPGPAPTGFLPDYAGGFDAANLALNGSAALDGTNLVLTNGGEYEAGSAFFTVPVTNVGMGTQSHFSFQIPNATANGFTYTIQNTGPNALGGNGAGLGYVGIHHSLALKFGLYSHDGSGSNSVGVYTRGNLPDTPDVDLTSSGIDLHSGHLFDATVQANNNALALVLKDTVTQASFTHTFTLASPLVVSVGETAYLGFTAGTGAGTSNPTITSWFVCSGDCIGYAPPQ